MHRSLRPIRQVERRRLSEKKVSPLSWIIGFLYYFCTVNNRKPDFRKVGLVKR